MGHPSVYLTGTTIYDRDAAWNGYTVFPSVKGAILIDMNGREVHVWKDLAGDYANSAPVKLLPGGFVLGSTAGQPFDRVAVAQQDWYGNTVWRFDHAGGKVSYDFERLGVATGGSTLLIVNRETDNPAVSGKTLQDSRIIEVAGDGKIVWDWNASEHFDELGFDEAAKNVIYRLPSEKISHGGQGYWLAINSVSALGQNKWYDAGDPRFHPDNIVFSARNANILAVIDKQRGKIVWRLGPDFGKAPFGWIIGPHHFHLIPTGLPGAGNFLVFDNGGWAGYGAPRDVSTDGTANQLRDFSRVLEFDPVSLAVAWQYTPQTAGHIHPLDSYKFYSPFLSSAQRLPNGNTLITEGSNGRIFEVTPEHTTVWEYVNPYHAADTNGLRHNHVSRAYRVPYEWAPQLPKPDERAVPALNVSRLRVAGAPQGSGGKVTRVLGMKDKPSKLVDDPFVAATDAANKEPSNFCVLNSGTDK